MLTTKVQTQPYKGARDFYPKDMQIRNYIFDTWKKVCKRYCFEEYDFPVLEPLETFSAKSSEEIINNQLFSFEDRSGRKIAVRPELTPGTVRMLAQKYNELTKPVKWFMIGSNWRYEKPQLGRGREFFQLEANIFGVEGVLADFEIICLIIDIMKEFGAKQGQFEILISDRRLISCLLNDVLKIDKETAENVRKAMDKKDKMTDQVFRKYLEEIGINATQAGTVVKFMESNLATLNTIIPNDILNNNEGYKTVCKLFELMKENNISQFARFDPAIIRGFEYSDGLVYEMFDNNPANKRSIFGGERFDKLINIFGDYDLPATGFAMGDMTFLEFLKNWGLLPSFDNGLEYFVSVWPSGNSQVLNYSLNIAGLLKSKNRNTFTWLDTQTKIDRQLKYANKMGYKYVLIAGDDEIKNSSVTIKNLINQEQTILSLAEFEKFISTN